MIEEPKINRNLALELLRVTEAGALAAAPLQGRGNKEAADRRAVEAIRSALASVDMKGTVVIGEGEKDEAPMLYFGEEIGNGLEPEVDVAVDPIEGTSLTASGLPGAISVVALAERGTMFTTHVAYMQKLVVGRRAKDDGRRHAGEAAFPQRQGKGHGDQRRAQAESSAVPGRPLLRL